MTRNDDERSNPPLRGDGAQTGFEAHDPKDEHEAVYTTTPSEDQVGASDTGKYTPVELPSAKVVTGTFDHLATRDVGAMEHTVQDPEFAGAETVDGLGGDILTDVAPSAGLGIPAAAGASVLDRRHDVDPNPGYIPPSNDGPPHVSEQPGDLPPGETPELLSEVEGTRRPR
jgi:hypothetical protein